MSDTSITGSTPERQHDHIISPEGRARRDALAARTDVLDKVGTLRTLPDDMHVTTEMVAEFYGVDPEVIRKLVIRNREELVGDGYVVVARAQLVRDMVSLTGVPKARMIALFPRRAVLRIGMLLRDSPVAREVRDYLLNVEHAAQEPVFVHPSELTRKQILEMALDSENRALAAEERIIELEPKAIKWDKFLSADGDYDVNCAAKLLHRWGRADIGETRLWALLRKLGWVSRSGLYGNGPHVAYQRHIDLGLVTMKPQVQYVTESGEEIIRFPQVRITPRGLNELHNITKGKTYCMGPNGELQTG